MKFYIFSIFLTLRRVTDLSQQILILHYKKYWPEFLLCFEWFFSIVMPNNWNHENLICYQLLSRLWIAYVWLPIHVILWVLYLFNQAIDNYECIINISGIRYDFSVWFIHLYITKTSDMMFWSIVLVEIGRNHNLVEYLHHELPVVDRLFNLSGQLDVYFIY